MTLNIDLPPETAKRLRAEAARLGVSAPDYVLRVLQTELAGGTSPVPPPRVVSPNAPRSGVELVAYWEREGVLGVWADRSDLPDSPDYARELRRQAERRGAV